MTPLSFACAEGHVDLVRLLLKHGASSDHAEEDLSLLQLAASRGFARIMSFLLDECSLRQGDAQVQQFVDRRRAAMGITALGLAARSGSVEAVAILLDRNAAWIPTRSGVTPLHNAAWGDKPHVVQLILERAMRNGINGDFSIDVRNGWGRTPLLDVIDRTNITVSTLLLDHGADYAACDSTNKSTLHYAVMRNQQVIVRRLLLAYDKNPKPGYLDTRNAHKNTALNEALGRKYWEIARVLLAHGAKWNPNEGRESPLHVAVEKNLDLARQYLTVFVEHPEQLRNLVNSRTQDGKTALHVAAALNLCEAAKLLLDHGADFAALNHAFRTPLHWAVHKDHVALARILLDAARAFPNRFEAFINQPSDLSTPALHEAVIRRHYDSIALLLAYGADGSQSCQNSDNESVLHMAIKNTNLSHRTTNAEAVLKLLLDNAQEKSLLHPMIDFRTNKYGNTALSEACQNKRLDAATLLLHFGADFTSENKDGATPLHAASWHGDLKMVKILFHFAGPGPDEKSDRFSRFVNKKNNAGYTALCMAAEQGHAAVTATLLRDFCADYTLKKFKNACSPLHLSAYRGHLKVVEVLLFQTSQDPEKTRFKSFINHQNVYGATAIIDAVEKNHLRITKLFLEQYNADYALADYRGCTTLHIAASRGYQDEVELLLSHASGSNNRSKSPRFQAYLNARNSYGKTALMDAMDFNRPSIIKILVGEYRADFTLTDNAGATALHYGTRKNHFSCVESLLHSISRDPIFESPDHPVSPFAIPRDFLDHANSEHQTAVMIACERGNVDMVDELLNGYKASYEIPPGNEDGGTLLHVAMGRDMAKNDSTQVLRILLKHVKSRVEDWSVFREWVERRDKKGRRVEAMAMSRGDQEALFVLMNALAR